MLSLMYGGCMADISREISIDMLQTKQSGYVAVAIKLSMY
jgi:hypothetical protein